MKHFHLPCVYLTPYTSERFHFLHTTVIGDTTESLSFITIRNVPLIFMYADFFTLFM